MRARNIGVILSWPTVSSRSLLLGLIVSVVELCHRYTTILIGWEGKYFMILGQILGNASNLYNFFKKILQERGDAPLLDINVALTLFIVNRMYYIYIKEPIF
jgi:hypothetical protein